MLHYPKASDHMLGSFLLISICFPKIRRQQVLWPNQLSVPSAFSSSQLPRECVAFCSRSTADWHGSRVQYTKKYTRLPGKPQATPLGSRKIDCTASTSSIPSLPNPISPTRHKPISSPALQTTCFRLPPPSRPHLQWSHRYQISPSPPTSFPNSLH